MVGGFGALAVCLLVLPWLWPLSSLYGKYVCWVWDRLERD